MTAKRKCTIEFNLNGETVEIETSPISRLLDVLREDFHLFGTKEACGEGECGTCVVFIDDVLINSCMVPMLNVLGKKIVTIEGYKTTKQFKVLEKSFLEAGAVQCGFCTPGMILASDALLRKNAKPSLDEIKEALSGNICRCTGYQMIFDAVTDASVKGEGLW